MDRASADRHSESAWRCVCASVTFPSDHVWRRQLHATCPAGTESATRIIVAGQPEFRLRPRRLWPVGSESSLCQDVTGGRAGPDAELSAGWEDDTGVIKLFTGTAGLAVGTSLSC